MLARHRPGDDGAVPIVEGLIDWIATFDSLEPAEQERTLLYRAAGTTHLGKGSNANWGGEKPRLVELQRRYRDLHAETRSAVCAQAALLGVLPDVERFVREYADERKKAGRADFDDLLFWASDLLAESEPARRYFRERFQAVLIDEFQDTDPVQAELALLLDQSRRARGGVARAHTGRRPTDRGRRPEAVDLPLPTCRHRRLRRGQDRSAVRAGGADLDQLPLQP